MDYYARNGDPLTVDQWAELHANPEYKILKQEHVGQYWVSTVWLGIDHGWNSNFGIGEKPKPVIFETMVFSANEIDDPSHRGLHDMDCRRYFTEEEAFAGHAETVLLIEATSVSIRDLLRGEEEDDADAKKEQP